MPKTKDYKVRIATCDDIFELTLLAREAYKGLPEKDHITFSSKKIGHLLETVMDSDKFLILSLVNGEEIVGYFFGVITDSFFAIETQATCLSLFIRPEHRGLRNALSLLKTYEEWGKKQGAVSVNIINIKMDSPKLYERLGYTMTEATFVKRTS